MHHQKLQLNTLNKMKFLDIPNQDKSIKKKILKDISKIIKKSNFILGAEVKKFEEDFAKYCGVKFGVGCANGTDALILAIESLGLPKNSEIILPAMTWCSTLFSVIKNNFKPVLVDIKKDNSTICVNDLKKKITKKTKAIILVHLYGECCNVIEVKKIIKNKKIFIIEDAAQAHGAVDTITKKKVGSLGDIGCFSFYPGKNLGAYGDAGFLTTNSKKIFNKLIMLRNMGSKVKHTHNIVGVNSRLDTIQAVILNSKLKFLDENNKARKLIAEFYKKNLNNKYIEKLNYSDGCVYHQYVIKVKKLARFISYLNKNNIPYGRHYPKSINKLTAVRKIFIKQKFKNAEKLAKECISLPSNPLLRIKDLKYICSKINEFK